jgi:hypothetical protein
MSGKKRQPERQQPVVEEEEAFPRGGADDLTPLERRKLALQAEADFKHEQDAAGAGGEAPSKKKQKRGNDQASFAQRSCVTRGHCGDSSHTAAAAALAATATVAIRRQKAASSCGDHPKVVTSCICDALYLFKGTACR